jgi:predicted aconitase
VVYANSVLDALTNREGGPSALAAAIVGKTPDYGVHKPENRRPNIQVNVEGKLENKVEYGALGIFLGKMLKDKIPAVPGLGDASKDKLKQFSAALATTGMTNLFRRRTGSDDEGIEKINVENKQIRQTIQDLSTSSTCKPDLVFLGCPHCSFSEISQIARLVEGKKVKNGTQFWVCTSSYVKEKAKEDAQKIENAGGHVLADVCTVVSWTETLGINTIMTNSAKTAYYAPTLNKAETILAPLRDCASAALKG